MTDHPAILGSTRSGRRDQSELTGGWSGVMDLLSLYPKVSASLYRGPYKSGNKRWVDRIFVAQALSLQAGRKYATETPVSGRRYNWRTGYWTLDEDDLEELRSELDE